MSETSFLCIECGRDVVVVLLEGFGAPDICAACMIHPGWPDHPGIAHATGPHALHARVLRDDPHRVVRPRRLLRPLRA